MRHNFRSRFDPCDMHRKKKAIRRALFKAIEGDSLDRKALHHSFTPGIQ